ncbi:MAG: LysE family transporter [Pseudomonadota bacterium]
MTLVLVTFALAHFAAVASPGPSFVVVMRETLSRGTVFGVWCALGLGLGTLIWAAAAWFGLAALFSAVPWLYAGLKLIGAVYLLYLAIQLWRYACDPPPETNQVDIAVTRRSRGVASALRRGVLTQLANPKVAVFFGSIFLALLPPDPAPIVLAMIFVIVFVNEVGWYAFVAMVMGSPPMRRRYARLKSTIDRATAIILGGLGVRIAVS